MTLNAYLQSLSNLIATQNEDNTKPEDDVITQSIYIVTNRGRCEMTASLRSAIYIIFER